MFRIKGAKNVKCAKCSSGIFDPDLNAQGPEAQVKSLMKCAKFRIAPCWGQRRYGLNGSATSTELKKYSAFYFMLVSYVVIFINLPLNFIVLPLSSFKIF